MIGIELNKHPAGRISNIVFGICQIADGLVRICSFGFAHSRWTLNFSKWQARRSINKISEKL